MSPRWPNEPKSDAPDAETEPVPPLAPPAAATVAVTPIAEETTVDEHGKSCPSCGAEMVQHGPDSPHKANAWHCNGCGGCWNEDLKAPRAGHVASMSAKA